MVILINYNELVMSLKNIDGAIVKNDVFHDHGVYRSVIIHIAPYDIILEYLDIDRCFAVLAFLASREGEKPVQLQSIYHLSDLLGVPVTDNYVTSAVNNTPDLTAPTVLKPLNYNISN